MKKVLSIVLLVSILLSSLSFTALAADEIIYTTADSQFSTTGSWAESTNKVVAGPTDGTSMYSTDMTATSTFDASGLEKGTYGVYYYMTPYGTTSDKVDITITASGKETKLLTDGMHGGSSNRHWIFLGKYEFDGSDGDGVTQAHNPDAIPVGGSAAKGCIRASAVKFVKGDTNTAAPDIFDPNAVKEDKPSAPANSAEGIVYTTGDAQFSKSGSWKESTSAAVKGPLGGTSWYTTDKKATATFDASGLEKGSYGVYIYMTPYATTADKVDVTITASGKSTKLLTEGYPATPSGHHWMFLGKYDFDGSAVDSVTQAINPEAVPVGGSNGTGNLRVSGVKFVKDDKNTAKPAVFGSTEVENTPAEPVEITYSTVPEVGNITIGTAHAGFSMKGNWKASSLAMPAEGKAYYGTQVGSTATWYPYLNKADNVEVFYLKPNATNTEDPALEIEVFANGETKKFVIDFTQPPTDWFSLGRYNFSGDGSEYVKVNKVSPTGTARLTCLKFSIKEEEGATYNSAFLGTDLHILERMGMLIGEGDGITEEYIKKVPTRVQAAIMILRLNGLDAEAAAFTGTDNFTDASQESWAMPYLAYLKAHPELGLIGTGDNMFEPTANIDAQAYAKILLTALGYEYNADFTWDETIAFAKEKGITVAESAEFTVNDLAVMTESIMDLKCKDGSSYFTNLIAKRDGVADEGVYGTELSAEMKAAREAAKNKKRGIIYNNDGNDVYHSYDAYPGAYDISHLDGTTINTENFLKPRSTGLEKTQVGTVFYCTGVFNSYTHESVGITDTRVRDWSRALKQYTGKDSLETMIDYVHSIDKDIFWSMRMNDTHDYKYEENELDPWKQANMDLLMYRKKDAMFMNFGEGRWSSVDYTLMPVRQVVYDILKDTITRYDIDGLELDLTRWPIFFKEVTQGIDVYPENIERMNNLVRMVRDLTEKISMERGKPILLAIYVPDSIEFCHDIGLDIKTWLDEDLIDIVSLGCIINNFKDWKGAFADYDGYDVQLYAALDPLSYDGTTEDTYYVDRNEAALAYEAGADGVYFYNYFWPGHERFFKLGSPETTGPVDPDYVSKRAVYSGRYIKDGQKYVNFNK